MNRPLLSFVLKENIEKLRSKRKINVFVRRK